MNVLFIHQNFPGQFRPLASRLAHEGKHNVLAICKDAAPGCEGVRAIRYRIACAAPAEVHPYLRSYDSGIVYGQAVAKVLLKLKKNGYRPDVIIAHPGWGETLFVKDIFPNSKLVHFCEFYYHSIGADAGFDPEFPLSIDMAAGLRARNAMHLLNLENCDLGITPTRWQHSVHPKAYQYKISIVHEGIRLQEFEFQELPRLKLPNGMVLGRDDEVVTYVARGLEPYRGFHSFMRALPPLLQARKNCQVVIVGGEDVSYGRKPDKVRSWKELMLKEVVTDYSRVHFMGKISYADYKTVLAVSSCHVYLTYPFVLSWSLLEAMAAGCLIVGSNTPPVREVVQDGVNGILVDFFDTDEISRKIIKVLASSTEFDNLRARAALDAREYCEQKGTSRYKTLLGLA
ncbi:glycosyltransferase family 4 protein [Pseudomonas bohemica]|uniref:glycosyltransferase family 4 protein n=1 Tax=Pseudomonas bohemica TaxID=2044872 RepID=UPI000DA62687|nr:glycosyltransferase family 4 protein [Pseudomonas bohemica]